MQHETEATNMILPACGENKQIPISRVSHQLDVIPHYTLLTLRALVMCGQADLLK